MKTVLFFRRFRNLRGGQIKVWDYFNHVLAADGFVAKIGFAARSNWDASNPWHAAREHVIPDWTAVRPDVFFVSGRDWLVQETHPDAGEDLPVVNLIQHVRHGDDDDPRFAFLDRRAIRICVSDEVAAALRATGRVNGPIFSIPNGIDLGRLPDDDAPPVDLAIASLKQPQLGIELERCLRGPGRRIDLMIDRLPRSDYLARLRKARVTLFLPNETEGFYLPALEGMALGTLVVCPDCVGNRSFCLPGHNAYRPGRQIDELVAAAESALALAPHEAERLRSNARRTAEQHGLERERRAFHEILNDIDRLWETGRSSHPGRPSASRSPAMLGRDARRREERRLILPVGRLETARLRQLPDFIIIGAQRGGTTSLYRALIEHPEIGAAWRKEIHFFDRHYDQGLDWYLAHFPLRGESPLVGEASPYYLFHPAVPERIRLAAPAARFVVMLRNPIDRAYSQYHMNVRHGDEPLSFEAAIAAEGERLAGSEDPSSPVWRKGSYLARGRYLEQLARWLSVFPREQFQIIRSEDFYRDPTRELARTLAHVGARPWAPERFNAYHQSTYPAMEPATRRELAAHFAPHNRALSDFLGMDLGWDDE